MKNKNLNFKVRDFMDLWTVKETFFDDWYQVFGFKIQPDWTIIDIGAAMGDFSILAGRVSRDSGLNHDKAKVFAFEPSSTGVSFLRENLELNNFVGQVSVYQKAISSSGQKLFLQTSGPPVSRSASHSDKGVGFEQVQSITLEEALTNNNLTRADLVKVDCEGGEFDILLNASNSLFERVDRWVIEFHEGRDLDHGTRFDLIAKLEKNGYQVDVFENAVHTDLGFIRAIKAGYTKNN